MSKSGFSFFFIGFGLVCFKGTLNLNKHFENGGPNTDPQKVFAKTGVYGECIVSIGGSKKLLTCVDKSGQIIIFQDNYNTPVEHTQSAIPRQRQL